MDQDEQRVSGRRLSVGSGVQAGKVWHVGITGGLGLGQHVVKDEGSHRRRCCGEP